MQGVHVRKGAVERTAAGESPAHPHHRDQSALQINTSAKRLCCDFLVPCGLTFTKDLVDIFNPAHHIIILLLAEVKQKRHLILSSSHNV